MSGTLVADAYADEEDAAPAEYYGGYASPHLQTADEAARALSDPISCEPVPSTFRFTMADPPEGDGPTLGGRLRKQLTSPVDRYWRDPVQHYMTSRANRALLGRQFNTFSGFIADAQPTFPLGWDITLVDVITQAILNDELEIPWRKIGEGFLELLDAVSETLDRTQPEPIIYGRHTRTTDVEPSPPAAWPVIPIYLGLETVGGTQYHVWMVSGHACSSVTMKIDGDDTAEGSDWLIATQAGFIAEFGAGYVDKPSATWGVDRRYSLIYGKASSQAAEDCALGEKQLTALVEGVETNGDCTGTLITNFYEQYKHLTVNYVANRAHFSYMSGAWLTAPTLDVSGETVSLVDEASFDAASDIWVERFGEELEGAIAIGFNGGSVQATQVIAQFNRDGFVGFGQTHMLQMGIIAMHPTQAAKDAAPLFTDATEVLQGTFQTTIQWSNQKTVVEFQCDYNPETALNTTTGISFDAVESERYNKAPRLKVTYAFVPGLTQCQRLADLLRILLTHPLRVIALRENVGNDEAIAVDPNRLAYQNLGGYIRYLHFDAVGGREERLAQIVKIGVHPTDRAALCQAIDLDDLIDFDMIGEAS